MSIEEQIAEIEARIGQLNIMLAGCTERAELAASRAEEAAMRAELAGQQSQQAELIATMAATTATTSAAIAVEQEEEIQEMIEAEEIEDASESIPDEGRSGKERETAESENLLDGTGETEERTEPSVQPIVITVKEHSPKQPTIFKPNRTAFNRGRTR